MSEPFLGEIIMFGGNFAPRGWMICDGQLLAISSNSALFSILGTIYGGDGRTTFALPDLRGRVAMGEGNGPGLTNRVLGQRGGSERNTLSTAQLPSHTHAATLRASAEPANTSMPGGNSLGMAPAYSAETPTAAMNGASIGMGNTGSNQAVNNLQPYQCVNFIIAVQGTFPSRS